jgi:hypothetical protein
LSRTEYLEGLSAAGFTDAEVTFTHEAAPGMHGAIVRANKPVEVTAGGCCSHAAQQSCCAPEAKADCCGDSAGTAGQCGCR